MTGLVHTNDQRWLLNSWIYRRRNRVSWCALWGSHEQAGRGARMCHYYVSMLFLGCLLVRGRRWYWFFISFSPRLFGIRIVPWIADSLQVWIMGVRKYFHPSSPCGRYPWHSKQSAYPICTRQLTDSVLCSGLPLVLLLNSLIMWICEMKQKSPRRWKYNM